MLMLLSMLSSCQRENLVQLTGVTWYASIDNPLWPYESIYIGFYDDYNPLTASVTMIGSNQDIGFGTDMSGERTGNNLRFTFDAYLDPRLDETLPVTLEATVSATEMVGCVTTSNSDLNFDFVAGATTSIPPLPASTPTFQDAR